MSEARVRVICNAFRLEPLVTRGRNFASGKGAAIAGRCERTVCSSAGHRRACPRSRLTLKEPGHNERKVAMSTARAASCTEARGVCRICLGRNDRVHRSGMRGRNYTPLRLPLRVITRHLPPGEPLIASRRAASLSHVCSKISVRRQRKAKTHI
jgi:hypothetical protein